ELLRRGAVKGLRLAAQLVELAQRLADRRLVALELGLGAPLGNQVLRHAQLGAARQVRLADGNAGSDAEPVQDALAAARNRPRLAFAYAVVPVSLHRTAAPPDPPGPSGQPRPVAPRRTARARTP